MGPSRRQGGVPHVISRHLINDGKSMHAPTVHRKSMHKVLICSIFKCASHGTLAIGSSSSTHHVTTHRMPGACRGSLPGCAWDRCRLHLPLSLWWSSLPGALGPLSKHLLSPGALRARLLGWRSLYTRKRSWSIAINQARGMALTTHSEAVMVDGYQASSKHGAEHGAHVAL